MVSAAAATGNERSQCFCLTTEDCIFILVLSCRACLGIHSGFCMKKWIPRQARDDSRKLCVTARMKMNHDTLTRYARQISLPQIGEAGQQRLTSASVLIVGAGGLGAPLALYLAGAGIGRLGIADPDRVALSNLPRQILYETADIGRLKVDAAADALHERNPAVKLELHPLRLDATNAEAVIQNYDIVADGSDNFATRLAVNAACHRLGKTLVSAAVLGWEGQISTYKSHLGAPHPCYQCLVGVATPQDVACSAAGVLGAIAGMLACWQGAEIIKELLGIGTGLSGRLLRFGGLNATLQESTLIRDPACVICSHHG